MDSAPRDANDAARNDRRETSHNRIKTVKYRSAKWTHLAATETPIQVCIVGLCLICKRFHDALKPKPICCFLFNLHRPRLLVYLYIRCHRHSNAIFSTRTIRGGRIYQIFTQTAMHFCPSKACRINFNVFVAFTAGITVTRGLQETWSHDVKTYFIAFTRLRYVRIF